MIALLTMEQTTQVTAGENRGREMNGDFTVIGLEEAGMYMESGQWRATVSLDTEEAQIPRAIVGWVSARPQGVVLQATGGWTTAE